MGGIFGFLGLGAGTAVGQQSVQNRASRDLEEAYECGGSQAANSILGEEQAGIAGGNLGAVAGSVLGMGGGFVGSTAGGWLGGAVGQSVGKLFGHNSHPYGSNGCPTFQGGTQAFNAGGYCSPNLSGGGQYFNGGSCGWPQQSSESGSQESCTQNYGNCPPFSPGGQTQGSACSQGYQQGLQYGQNQPWSNGNCSPSQGSPSCGSTPQGSVSQTAPGQPSTITTPGGWQVQVSGSTVTMTDPSGKHTVQEWGDPHEKVDGTAAGNWNDPTRTLMLPDGTRVTMSADAANQPIQSTSVYMNGRSVNIDNSDNTITSQSFNPQQTSQEASSQAEGQVVNVQENSQGLNLSQLYKQDSVNQQNPYFGIQPDYKQIAYSPTSYSYQQGLNNPRAWQANQQTAGVQLG